MDVKLLVVLLFVFSITIHSGLCEMYEIEFSWLVGIPAKHVFGMFLQFTWSAGLHS